MGGKDFKAFTEERGKARYDENREISQANRALRTDLAQERAKREEAEALTESLRTSLSLYTAPFGKQPEWLKASKITKEHRGSLVAFFSDPHYGEVVSAAELGGYNKYNLAIAEKRTERFFRRTVILARDFLAGVQWDGIVLVAGGDLVSGDIHDELTGTNELTTYDTILWALPRLKTGIEMWLEEFKQVHIVSSPGNHGRRTKIPVYKRRSADNADTALMRHLALLFKDVKGVTFNIPESIDTDFNVYGSRFTLSHGDELMKNFSGSAEIGALGPMARGTLRNRTQKAAQGKPFDYKLIAHFHQYIPVATQGFIANGSLKGYDEYASGKHFKPEAPQQALMVVTPEHGITTQMPVFVADRKAEGW